ncbi:MAG: PEP-CTERM sorting domain-containing protein [Armatimonadaceae bacterium]
MKFSSLRSAVVIASVIAGSIVPSQAFAQIYVLTGGSTAVTDPQSLTSTYRFTGSMILNSIGFYTNGLTLTNMSYTLKGSTYNYNQHFFDSNLSFENGVKWLNIGSQSMVNDEIVTVTTLGPSNYTPAFEDFTVNPNANVAYQGMTFDGANSTTSASNSNLRVSNPGSNVAPEPGTFALALTGGAALIGVCIRRRRNAA